MERRKRAQRIRDFARSAGVRSVEAVSDVPPAALSFPLRRKIGEKRVLGDAGCVLRVRFR